MKFLKFVILKRLYINLILLAFIFPSLGELGGGLYAQDPQLFEHTWYFANGVIDGEPFLSPDSNFITELYIYNEGLNYLYVTCNQGWGFDGIDFDINNNIFLLPDGPIFIGDECTNNQQIDFTVLHNLIYFTNNTFANNPFIYTVEIIDDYSQLTLENGQGDWAVYNSVLLSTPTFHPNNFTLYPNPVKEVLQVNNSSNQPVSAIIYDINGKKLQTQSLEINLSTIYVKALNPGLYFVVFESETGERVSKKFVKK